VQVYFVVFERELRKRWDLKNPSLRVLFGSVDK
jgi:hypothetical protein